MTSPLLASRGWSDRRLAAVLFVVLGGLSLRLLISAQRQHVLTSDASPLLYHAGTLALNYADFGVVRRGLGGSLVRLLNGDLLRATAIFHVISALAVSSVACVLFARLRRNGWQQAAFAMVLVALMVRWAEDAGRTDMAVAALIGVAAILLVGGRPALAVLCAGVGLAIHESAFVFGIPLMLALLLDGARWRRIPMPALAAALALLAAILVLYAAIPLFPHATAETMAAAVQDRLPRSVIVDWAIYFGVSGSRGVRMSMCQNRIDPTYLRHALSGALVIGVVLLVLRARCRPSWGSAAIACGVPYVFLCIVANDTSRWAYLGAFNAWLLCALVPTETARTDLRGDRLRLVGAASLVALVHPAFLKADTMIYVPAPIIDRVAQHFGGPKMPRFVSIIERCDPDWRSVLGGHGGLPR